MRAAAHMRAMAGAPTWSGSLPCGSGSGGSPPPRLELQSAVLNRLMRVPGAVVPITDLVDAAYGDECGGGPMWAEKSIRHAVGALPRRGWSIEAHWGRGYRLGAVPHE